MCLMQTLITLQLSCYGEFEGWGNGESCGDDEVGGKYGLQIKCVHLHCSCQRLFKWWGDARLWCPPSIDEYDKLIQSLCLKALDWEMAKKLQEEMKGSGLRVKGITGGLIRVVKETKKEVVEAESITTVA